MWHCFLQQGKFLVAVILKFFLRGNCLCRADCNFQSGEWRWKIVFSNLIVGGKNGDVQDFCSPCGICRQGLSEFCKPDFKIILASSLTDFKVFTLSDLLPESFSWWWIFEMLFERNSAYFHTEGYNSVCVAVFSWWMKEDCKIRIYCTLNFLG